MKIKVVKDEFSGKFIIKTKMNFFSNWFVIRWTNNNVWCNWNTKEEAERYAKTLS